MTKLTLGVCTAFLTFSLGIACALVWPSDRGSVEERSGPDPAAELLTIEAEPMDLLFCHLVAAPENYDGRVIRVRATYVTGIHGSSLIDRSCPVSAHGMWVSISPAMWDEIERVRDRAYKMEGVSGPLEVMAVGRFERNFPSGKSDALADNAPYKFELMRIDRFERPR